MDESREETQVDEGVVVEIAKLALGIARKLVAREVAEDVSQDIALSCLARMRKGAWEVRRESLPALVRQMVQRRVIDRRRRSGREDRRAAKYLKASTADPVWMTPGADDEAREFEEFRERALEMLPPRCRETYLLVEQARLTYAEVAERLGVTRSAVAWQMGEARRRIRAEIGTEKF
jgi:RNA polymerase sigma factor (sigma-70 family)